MLADRLGDAARPNGGGGEPGGAAGVIAAEMASRAEPDGYTLFLATIAPPPSTRTCTRG
jgi:hypothetical protein